MVGGGGAVRGGEEVGGGGAEVQTENRRLVKSMGSWCKVRLLGSAALFLGSASPPRPRGGRSLCSPPSRSCQTIDLPDPPSPSPGVSGRRESGSGGKREREPGVKRSSGVRGIVDIWKNVNMRLMMDAACVSRHNVY